jgi:hypothetical protein
MSDPFLRDFEVQTDPGPRGRFVMTRRAHRRGSVLFVEAPVAAVLSADLWRERCLHCHSEASLQCARCEVFRFCSREHQVASHATHRHECAALARGNPALRAITAESGFELGPDAAEAVLLLCRTVRAMERENKAREHGGGAAGGGNAAQAGESKGRPGAAGGTPVPPPSPCPSPCPARLVGEMPSNEAHMRRHNPAVLAHATAVARVAHVALGERNSPGVDALVTLALQGHCNNFSIEDELLTRIGSGVFVNAALLNHAPRGAGANSFFRYKRAASGAYFQVCVAAFDLAPGTELCHSYVDMVTPAREMAELLFLAKAIPRPLRSGDPDADADADAAMNPPRVDPLVALRTAITETGAVLGPAIERGDYRTAEIACRKLVGVQRQIYPASHPIIGLQLETLADLIDAVGASDRERAAEAENARNEAQRILHMDLSAFRES